MKSILLTLALLFVSSPLALAQATPSATRADFQAGATFSFVKPDYTPQNASAYGVYTDYFVSRNFGAELDFHRASISQHSPATETSFNYGVIYRRIYGSYHPFVRASFGRAAFDFPTGIIGPSASAADLSFNEYAVAGGVDLMATRYINIRAEAEYQSWFAGPGLINGLTPLFISVGAAYHFNPRSPNY